MKNAKTITQIALCAALVFVSTLLALPMSQGYINAGDAFVFASSIIVSPICGMIAGSLGATLSDVVLGYAVYAPFTLVIKGLEGLLCGLIFRASSKVFGSRALLLRVIVPSFISALVMCVGYFAAESIIFSLDMAVVSIAFNAVQGVVSVVLTAILSFIFSLLRRNVGGDVNGFDGGENRK